MMMVVVMLMKLKKESEKIKWGGGEERYEVNVKGKKQNTPSH
jgi:hypothetical protein